MESKAILRNASVSARKARLLVDMVRGKDVASAIKFLGFTNKKCAPMVGKIIKSAVANAEQAGVKDPDMLYVKSTFVDEGPTMKRFMCRAMGRSTKILKRSCHITVVLAER